MTENQVNENRPVRFQYKKYRADYEIEYETLYDAMVAAFKGSDYGELDPIKIIDGADEYGFDDMCKYWKEHEIK